MMAFAHPYGPSRYMLIQAVVLLLVFVVLAVTPAPVTFPNGPWEVVLLVKGAAALLLADLLLMGVARKEVARQEVTRRRTRARAMDRQTALEWSRIGHYHVVEANGVVGLVDEVLAGRDGTPQSLVVSDGWFGRRRFVVPLDDLRSVNDAERTITISGGE